MAGIPGLAKMLSHSDRIPQGQTGSAQSMHAAEVILTGWDSINPFSIRPRYLRDTDWELDADGQTLIKTNKAALLYQKEPRGK